MSCHDDMVRRAGSNSKEMDPQGTNTTEVLTEKEYETTKKYRTTRRRHLTIYCKEISNMVGNRKTRKEVSLSWMMLEQAKEAFEEGEEYILLFIRERGNRWVTKKKMLRCLHYQQLIEEAQELVKAYLYERKDDDESEKSEWRDSLECKERTGQVTSAREDRPGCIDRGLCRHDNSFRVFSLFSLITITSLSSILYSLLFLSYCLTVFELILL